MDEKRGNLSDADNKVVCSDTSKLENKAGVKNLLGGLIKGSVHSTPTGKQGGGMTTYIGSLCRDRIMNKKKKG